ncbi:MAG: Kinase similar to eukaryotic-like N-acetylglucosamine kinase [uncultured Chloroflexi bacterium]|uniref:Kinase similar to eukaryotic-like N-acetylglucosamine kinase n=1 Tax=uncultured Chloroflexota bacterium TaxID=166587 RepID=A0A6J4HTG3_9CHLR|nr:MAG: Kinase similar to eukaryotic-like N-acetylglucosamine kinase [uncultured Chloroflexota bacterium]
MDGGGSKTVCAVATPYGVELGRATTGPSNYQAVGLDTAATRVREAMQAAVEDACRRTGGEIEIVGRCLALAGVARPEDHQAWRGVLPTLPGGEGPVAITHDAMAALVGGTGRKLGVVAIAGTGAIALGVNAHGEERRASGWGYVLGDEGSGYAIGLAGLRAVCRAADGRGAETALTDRVVRKHGLDRLQALVRLVYGEWKPADIAANAPLVLRAAEDGDSVARAIVEDAAAELALASTAVIRGIGLAEEPVEVVTVGGLWDASPLLQERFAAHVRDSVPRVEVIRPRGEPVTGAVLLAREAAGG